MQKNIAFFQKNHSHVVTISQHRVITNISGDMGETLEEVSPISPCQSYKNEMLIQGKQNEPTIKIGFVCRCRAYRSGKQKRSYPSEDKTLKAIHIRQMLLQEWLSDEKFSPSPF